MMKSWEFQHRYQTGDAVSDWFPAARTMRSAFRQPTGPSHAGRPMGDHMLRDFLFLILFFVLLGVWATAWMAFHVAGGMIHLLLIIAIISLVIHLFRGKRAA
jgi:hypothetical protein